MRTALFTSGCSDRMVAVAVAIAFIFISQASAWPPKVDRLPDLENAIEEFGHVTYYHDTGDVAISITSKPTPAGIVVPLSSRMAVTYLRIEAKVNENDVNMIVDAFPNIRIVDVERGCWNSQIAVKGAEQKKIEELWISLCDLSPGDLKHIGKMTSLQLLSMGGNTKAGEGLDALSGLTKLRQLRLSDVKVPSAEKLKWLSKNKDLTAVWLDGTGLDDEIVPILKQLPKITLLSVENTKVSPAGCKELEALPSIKIFLENQPDE